MQRMSPYRQMEIKEVNTLSILDTLYELYQNGTIPLTQEQILGVVKRIVREYLDSTQEDEQERVLVEIMSNLSEERSRRSRIRRILQNMHQHGELDQYTFDIYCAIASKIRQRRGRQAA